MHWFAYTAFSASESLPEARRFSRFSKSPSSALVALDFLHLLPLFLFSPFDLLCLFFVCEIASGVESIADLASRSGVSGCSAFASDKTFATVRVGKSVFLFVPALEDFVVLPNFLLARKIETVIQARACICFCVDGGGMYERV